MMFHFSPVAHYSKRTNDMPKLVKLLLSFNSSCKITVANMFMPITEKMKNIKMIREPTFAIEGKITIKLSTKTLRFLLTRISLNTLMILMALMIESMVTTVLSSPVFVNYSITKLRSATITIDISNRFQLLSK